jgi:hypothetical protein
MAKTNLDINSDFIVGEEKILNYILAILCFALFMYGAIDAARRHFIHIDYQSFFFALALIPAYFFLKKARSKRVFIRINKKGIYNDEKLVTGWANLLKAYIAEKERKGIYDIQDHFFLALDYKKDGSNGVVKKKIPLTNTQNKSEEEILEAVKFFWTIYKYHSSI